MMKQKMSQKQIDKILEMSLEQLLYLSRMFREFDVNTLFAECVVCEIQRRLKTHRSEECVASN
jgi:hypothetical protein